MPGPDDVPFNDDIDTEDETFHYETFGSGVKFAGREDPTIDPKKPETLESAYHVEVGVDEQSRYREEHGWGVFRKTHPQ